MAGRLTAAGAVAYLEGLSPWPEEFGLAGMKRLLAGLGEPQRRFRSIHVVGTNGKTSTTLMAAALLRAAGLRVGATISPHVRDWAERIQVDGQEVDLVAALERIRPLAAGATQFEVLTAAAFAEFAAAGVEAAVVEAGLGGRLDATNVLDAPVVVLTNVALEHTAVLGPTRQAIAAEKLAVTVSGAHVVLGESEWEPLARSFGAAEVIFAPGGNLALARAAAGLFLDAPVEAAPAGELIIPGRLERRGEAPLEIWDGAHNPAGVRYLLEQLPPGRYTIVASILADKDAAEMLQVLARLGDTFIATRSANPRALDAAELAQRARPYFTTVETLSDPVVALARARERAAGSSAVLVTGSLYLLSELSRRA